MVLTGGFYDGLSSLDYDNDDPTKGTSFHRTTQTDTGSQGTTTECGERPRPSTMVTPARELTLTGLATSDQWSYKIDKLSSKI